MTGGIETIRQEAGWFGHFTRHQALGCYKNGTRVRKVASALGDTHQDGALGTILGSIDYPDVGVGYFVEWDSHPRHAVLVVARRVQPEITP